MFDNLKDVRQKFEATICYFNGQAVLVKSCAGNEENTKFTLSIATWEQYRDKTRGKIISVDDPLFTYRAFNLGYLQLDEITCPWLYRTPIRQYKQGLHLSSQVMSTFPDGGGYVNYIGFCERVANMLENKYPDLETAFKTVRDNRGYAVAPHKDFKISYDELHADYIVEYRGAKIGSLSGDRTFKLLSEMRHLQETLKEEVLKVSC